MSTQGTTDTPRPLTAADLPPSPPPSKRRGMGTVRSMIISMVVLTALMLGFYAIVARPDRAERLPVDAVAAVKNARTVGKVGYSALEPTPAGWSANNASYQPGADGVPTWSVGYVHDGRYGGLRQAAKATEGWFQGQLDGFVADGTRQLDGAPWQQWKNSSTGEFRLVKRAPAARPGAVSSIVVSSVSYDDAAALIARLTPKP